MNYLAHAYLSFNHPRILVGNMISDFVKGRRQFDYDPAIQHGIQLHRAIDTYTDNHPATRQAMLPFKSQYGLYAGPIADIMYDHFLATDLSIWNDDELMQFSQETYSQLEPFAANFPSRFAQMFPYMKSQNWLYNYKNRWAIKNSLQGLERRATYLGETATAFSIFEKEYEVLQHCYHLFFDDVKLYAQNYLKSLTGKSAAEE